MAVLLPYRLDTRSLCRSKENNSPPTSVVLLRSLLQTLVVFRAAFGWKLLFWTPKTTPLTRGSLPSPRPRGEQIGRKLSSTGAATVSGRLRSPETARLSNPICLLGKNNDLCAR